MRAAEFRRPKEKLISLQGMSPMLEQIDEMLKPGGFDAIIVCTSSTHAELFWQRRLEQTITQVANHNALVLAVTERSERAHV